MKKVNYFIKGDACPECGRGLYITNQRGNIRAQDTYKFCRQNNCPNYNKQIYVGKKNPDNPFGKSIPETKELESSTQVVPVNQSDEEIAVLNKLLDVYSEWDHEGGSGELKEALRETLIDYKEDVLKRMTKITPEELYDAFRKLPGRYLAHSNPVVGMTLKDCEDALNTIYISKRK